VEKEPMMIPPRSAKTEGNPRERADQRIVLWAPAASLLERETFAVCQKLIPVSLGQPARPGRGRRMMLRRNLSAA
jgi:hypothetical protein